MPIEASARSGWPGIGGGSAGFSKKSTTRCGSSTCMTPKARASSRGTGRQAIVRSALAAAVLGDHRRVVHLVDVVAGQDQRLAGLLALDPEDVLVDRVGGAGYQVSAIRCSGGRTSTNSPRLRARNFQAWSMCRFRLKRLVLRQDQDLPEAGVDAVREGEVDDPVDAAERHGRLGAVAGQGLQPGALPAGQDDGQHILHQTTAPTRRDPRLARRVATAILPPAAATNQAAGGPTPADWR